MQVVSQGIEVEAKNGGKFTCRKLRQSVLLKLPEACPRDLTEDQYNTAAAVLMFRWCVTAATGFEAIDGGAFMLARSKHPVLGTIASEDLIDVVDLEHDIQAVVEACLPENLTEDAEKK